MSLMWPQGRVGMGEVRRLRKLGRSQVTEACYSSFSSGQEDFKTNLRTMCGSKLGTVFKVILDCLCVRWRSTS